MGPEGGQRAGLELDDLGLVDLVNARSSRPRQPVRLRVEAGGQDHRLTDARFGRRCEEFVEELGSHRHVVGHALHAHRRTVHIQVGRRELTGGQPGEEVHAHRPHQRFGVRVGDQAPSPVLAIARAAATIVAVAPTLEARVQVSSSVRAISSPMPSVHYLADITDRSHHTFPDMFPDVFIEEFMTETSP